MVTSEPGGLDLESLRELVNVRLAQLVPEGRPQGPSSAARYSLLAPGKRLRAMMVLIAARSLGGRIEDALDTACAVEMVHTASLVFDDLPAMDDADLRRGIPTAHMAYGQDIAILAGIGLMNGAYEVVSQAQAPSCNRRMDILRVLTRAIGWQGLVHGQALDLSSGAGDAAIDAIHEGKTGALFVAAAEAGGLCAEHCSDAQRRDMRAYGRALGFAYQAYDDVLDQSVGDETAGKTTGQDEGKSTAVLGRETSIAAGLQRAHGHLETAMEAAGKGSPLAMLAEYIGVYFSKTLEPVASDAIHN
ncbi:MAG: polyprenyl synthetase family protein [Pseudomonadota bacterium]